MGVFASRLMVTSLFKDSKSSEIRSFTEVQVMNNKVYDISGNEKDLIYSFLLHLLPAIAVITVIKGVEIAIEFKGGTIISYSYEGDASIKDAQSEIEDLLKTPVVIQEGENLSNDSNSFSISFSYDTGLSVEDQTALTELLQEKFPDNKVELLDSNDVNPTSGKEFFLKCAIASILAAALIIIYIALDSKR